MNPYNRQIIGFHIGDRSQQSAHALWKSIPAIFHEKAGFFSDYWQAYKTVFQTDNHFSVGKDSGLTAYIERFNNTLRQRCSRLVRNSLSFSKNDNNHIGAIKYFICHYNQEHQHYV